MARNDPDPWCEEDDGEYVPPKEPEVTVVQGDESDVYDRWNDKEK